MDILVTADTHIPDWYDALPARLVNDAKKSDLIVIAGDIVSREVIETLESYARVEAVHGNFCHIELKRGLPSKKVVELDGWKMGITHGHLGTGRNCEEKAVSLFDEHLDLLIHGHTHHHHKAKVGNLLVIDPGSPLDTKFTATRSYARVRLDDEVRVDFVILD